MSDTVKAIMFPKDYTEEAAQRVLEFLAAVHDWQANEGRVIELTQVGRIAGMPMPDNIYRMEGGGQ